MLHEEGIISQLLYYSRQTSFKFVGFYLLVITLFLSSIVVHFIEIHNNSYKLYNIYPYYVLPCKLYQSNIALQAQSAFIIISHVSGKHKLIQHLKGFDWIITLLAFSVLMLCTNSREMYHHISFILTYSIQIQPK